MVHIVAVLPPAEHEILAGIIMHGVVSVIQRIADDGLKQNRKPIWKANFFNVASACCDFVRNGRDAFRESLIDFVRQSLHERAPGRSSPRKRNPKPAVPAKCKRVL